MLRDCPFSEAQIAAATQLYVNLLDKPLDDEQLARIGELSAEGEQCVIGERAIYLLLTPSILDSAFAVLFQKDEAHAHLPQLEHDEQAGRTGGANGNIARRLRAASR
ncbi:hypothetical protein OMP38_24980 [Cohnella ginsengisoli]|uniref:Uncharacterized protein n=1 Tax=Cohnella ginsengisoli TaxID=425004 RepID=A0A9X4KLR0_9BACL|nr:hypothetical protein [Cohnella ginsengisoli]MDG0793719.1 hypothetical protein [Cohnella ginsengisoli]